jgi:protein gp37
MFDSILTGKYWDVGLSLIEGCSPIRCSGCWAAQASNMRKNNPFVAHRHEGLTEVVNGEAKFNGKIRIFEKELLRPLARKKPTAYQIWTDLFHYHVPDETVARAFDTFASCEKHIFFVLTQRPERMVTFLKCYYENYRIKPLQNVIVGTTVRDTRDVPRLEYLCATPAAARIISAEPLRGLLVLTEWLESKLIDGVLIGGGTGCSKETTHSLHVESLINQAKYSEVNVFFKSWGNNCPGQIPRSRTALGQFWNQLPIATNNDGLYRVKSIREKE